MASFQYNKPLIQTKMPSGRGGASVCHADGKIIVFGGTFFAGDDKFEYLDETWILDTDKLAWHKILCSGQLPAPRYGHSAHIVGSRMFIIGGKGPHGAMYGDVFFLDLIEWIWVPVSPLSAGPSPRFLHASELVGRKIVIHGGWDSGSECYNDLWIFNTDSFAWMQPKTAGFGPTPRYGHTMTLTTDGRILTFGGSTITESGLPKYLDDLRQLDTESMIWSRPRLNGNIPTARYGHSAILLENDVIGIFGGWGRGGCQSSEHISNPNAHSVHYFDVKTMSWIVPSKTGKKEMRHLYNHGACRSGSAMLCFGGFDGRQATNEFVVINMDIGDVY